LGGPNIFDLKQAEVFGLRHHLSKHERTRYARNLGAIALLTFLDTPMVVGASCWCACSGGCTHLKSHDDLPRKALIVAPFTVISALNCRTKMFRSAKHFFRFFGFLSKKKVVLNYCRWAKNNKSWH